MSWQRAPLGGDVLLVGVDCAVEDQAVEPRGAEPLGDIAAEGAALVTRWVRPAPEVLERLDAIVEALARMAEELEAAHPDAVPDPE